MKATRQLNIKDKEGHFFTDMINSNNFDCSLLHVNRTVIDYDFTIYDIKYVKNLNKIGNLYLVFNYLDAVFRKSGKNKYLIFSSTEKIKAMLENCTDTFGEIAEQIESMTDDKVKYHKDIMRIKFKTNDDLVFNEIINIPVCVIVVSSIFEEDGNYYPQISSHDYFYEHDVPPDV